MQTAEGRTAKVAKNARRRAKLEARSEEPEC
jgi:hypothetical protein